MMPIDVSGQGGGVSANMYSIGLIKTMLLVQIFATEDFYAGWDGQKTIGRPQYGHNYKHSNAARGTPPLLPTNTAAGGQSA